MRSVFTIFSLPFWVFLAAAGGLFYVGELSHRDTLAQNQEMARALAGTPPETVDIVDFSRQNDVGPADEVSVQVVINPAYNYELTKRRKGRKTTRFMYVLFDAADPEDSKVARGALVLTAAEKDKFVDEYYVENAELGIGPSGFVSVLTLNGQVENSSDLSSLVNEAFDEQNLTKSGDFIYIKPFLEGRTVGLTPTMSADEIRNIMRGIGAAVALIGLVKFALRRRRKAPAAAAPETAFAMDSTGASSGQINPAGLMPNQPSVPETAAEPKPKKPFPVKLLVILALLGAAIYSGQLALVAIIALVALQFLAVRKTRHLITGVLAKVTGRATADETSEEKIMANVQVAARDIAGPENVAADTSEPEMAPAKSKKRGFSLPFQMRRREPDEVTATVEVTDQAQNQPEEAETAEPSKRGFSFALPSLRRGADEDADVKIETNSAGNEPEAAAVAAKPKRGLSLSLPLRRRKAEAADSTTKATSSMLKKPRKKEAFQSAELFASDEPEEAQGLAGKVQLLMARLTPAERQPKAFADRPDPFERLAAEVQRTAAR